MIIDQHVAHERILYERAMSAFEHSTPFSQQLLFPHVFHVSAGDQEIVREYAGDLHKLGFILDASKPGRITVEAVPQDVRVGMEESILEEMLEEIKTAGYAEAGDHRHRLAASYACRTAIKAGEKLSTQEMQSLIDHLFQTENPFVCPHGRPVVIKLSLQELDYRFGRS
jgi:DNA mismatch repair protein MutL